MTNSQASSNEYFEVPASYAECTKEQFTELTAYLFDLQSVPAIEVRLNALELLTKRIFLPDLSKCSQYISWLTSFIFNIQYENDVLKYFTPETAKVLEYAMPGEINDPEILAEIEPRISQLKAKPIISRNIRENPIKELVLNGRTFIGAAFTIDKAGALYTTLRAGAFTDAQDFMELYYSTGDNVYLENIAACLYYEHGVCYKTSLSQENAANFSAVDIKVLKSIAFMLLAWQRFLADHEHYRLLFTPIAESKTQKISQGAAEVFYRMARNGYGSVEQNLNMLVTDYLGIQVDELKQTISSLRAYKKTDADIAKDLQLPLETVLKL